jgi:hypothetical protein
MKINFTRWILLFLTLAIAGCNDSEVEIKKERVTIEITYQNGERDTSTFDVDPRYLSPYLSSRAALVVNNDYVAFGVRKFEIIK